METQIFEEYLKDRYEKQLKWYGNQSFRNQRCYQRLQWVTIVLSVLVPVLVVERHYGPEWFTAILSCWFSDGYNGVKDLQVSRELGQLQNNRRSINDGEVLLRCRST